MDYKDKYIKYKTKYLGLNNMIGGSKKDLQFILFGDVMTSHQVWFRDKDNNKIDLVKKLKKIRRCYYTKTKLCKFSELHKSKRKW